MKIVVEIEGTIKTSPEDVKRALNYFYPGEMLFMVKEFKLRLPDILGNETEDTTLDYKCGWNDCRKMVKEMNEIK